MSLNKEIKPKDRFCDTLTIGSNKSEGVKMLSVSPFRATNAVGITKLNIAGQANVKNIHQNERQNVQYLSSNPTKLPGYEFYSDIAFTNRRKPLTLEEKFARIKPEQFPSKRIINNIKAAIEDPDNEKTMYQIHIETYAPLLECKTLDEAKAMFPEFENVKDARDLFLEHGTRKDKEKAFRSAPYIAQRVFEKSMPEVKIEDLSLDLLKKVYGRGYTASAEDKFYGFSRQATVKLLDELNIKQLDEHYARLINGDNPDIREKRKTKVKQTWSKDTAKGKARREEAEKNGHKWWDSRTDEQKQEIIQRLYDNNKYVKARKRREAAACAQVAN